MTDDEIRFSISLDIMVAYTDKGEKYLLRLYYNEFVNMIVRDIRWPVNVFFVTINAARGRLVNTNWAEIDFLNMIETLVANGYTVTITDANTYMITKTLDTGTIEKQSAVTILDRRGGKGMSGSTESIHKKLTCLRWQ